MWPFRKTAHLRMSADHVEYSLLHTAFGGAIGKAAVDMAYAAIVAATNAPDSNLHYPDAFVQLDDVVVKASSIQAIWWQD